MKNTDQVTKLSTTALKHSVATTALLNIKTSSSLAPLQQHFFGTQFACCNW